ncbi:MAG TPA: hypothetical protein VJN68_14060, partial [Burkholderiaceae bacterium]|nr:hypothetical protein [Burkholderiaceae bacterium]
MKALKPAGIYRNVTTPVRTLAMRWAAITSGKTIITGDHPAETPDDLLFLKELIEGGKGARGHRIVGIRWNASSTLTATWIR